MHVKGAPINDMEEVGRGGGGRNLSGGEHHAALPFHNPGSISFRERKARLLSAVGEKAVIAENTKRQGCR